MSKCKEQNRITDQGKKRTLPFVDDRNNKDIGCVQNKKQDVIQKVWIQLRKKPNWQKESG